MGYSRYGGWKRALPTRSNIWMRCAALGFVATEICIVNSDGIKDVETTRKQVEARNKASRDRAAQARQYVQQPPSPIHDNSSSSPHHSTSISKWNRYNVEMNDVLNPKILATLGISVASGTQMGKRTYHEDRLTAVSFELPSTREPLAFVAVYDGHGGTQCATYMQTALHPSIKSHLSKLAHSFKDAPLEAIQRALKDACAQADHAFLESHLGDDSGSCGVFALVGQDKWVVGNIGDSQVIVNRRGRAIDLCVAHSPKHPDERTRILAANGHIVQDRYIFGYLGVSRSFGDRFLKIDRPVVITTPDVVSSRRRPDDEFLLLACDGLFEVFTPQDAVDFISHHITINQMAPQAICELLVQTAIENGSQDNVSVILVMLK